MISIWEQDTFYRNTDVFIIGGGLMGLWTAYELLIERPGLGITITDALPVPALASTRNAGFACFGSPSELWSDRESLGESKMLEIVAMRYRGIEKIRKVFGDKLINYDACGGFEVYDKDEAWNGDSLMDKLAILNRGLKSIIGETNMYFNCSNKLETLGLVGFKAMAGNSIEGGLHSGKLVLSLMAVLQSKGVVLLSGHKVLKVEGTIGNLQAVLTAGAKEIQIKCKSALWATNASLSQMPELENLVKPARGQVLLSPSVEAFALKGTFHYNEGFFYFRNLGNRLLIGGARNLELTNENTLTDETTGEIKQHLEHFITKHIPQAAAILSGNGWLQWAGIMGMSQQKIPFVKNLNPGIWCALACNGMGVALTPEMAKVAANQLLSELR
jgi:glycine/D-amino acid oxidase-like deaminating enzyme